MPGSALPPASRCRRSRVSLRLALGLCAALAAPAAGGDAPQAVPSAPPPASSVDTTPDAVLVMPPESETASAEPNWVGELVSELLPRGLLALGVPAVERDDRLRAQAALEIPVVPLTRATSIRVAEALGARRLVFGTYAVREATITLTLRVLDVGRAGTAPPVVVSAPLRGVGDLAQGVAWDVAGALGRAPAVSREEFTARRTGAPYEAMEALGKALVSRRPPTRSKLLRHALGLAPDLAEARLALGRLQVETGEYSAAHGTLARVPASSGVSRSARFLMGVSELQIGRYADATATYSNLAAERPTPAVLNNQALAVLRDPRAQLHASDILRRALEQAPDSADIAFNLGWALLYENDPAAAEFFLRGLVRRDPLEGHARVVLSWALRKAGRAEDASKEWEGVLAMAPNYAGLVTPDLARRFERILPSERLRPDARAERSTTEVAAGLVGRADRLLASGDAPGALRDLERAAYLDPYAQKVHLLLARAHRAQGNRERALNELRMTLWSQDDPAVRAEMAQLLLEMGRRDEARQEAERVLKLDPGNEVARKVVDGG